jgi:hypothetical protein
VTKIKRKQEMNMGILAFITPPSNLSSAFSIHFKTYRNGIKMSKLKRGRLHLPLSGLNLRVYG